MKLPKVADRHRLGIFGEFRGVIQSRIAELKAEGGPHRIETARFFEYLLTQVDAEAYAKIQRHYLSREVLDPHSDIAKYLDPIVWFESKLRIARKLGLDKKPPLNILDFGTGPGHFPVVARFYGHNAVGTELPRRSMGTDKTGHLYDALCEVYKVDRISHTIRPNESVGNLGRRFEIVTAFLAAFNVDEAKKPWTADHWHFFLRSLREAALAPHGVLFMTLANHKLSDESWGYLKSLAEQADDKSKQILISNFSAID